MDSKDAYACCKAERDFLDALGAMTAEFERAWGALATGWNSNG